MDPSREIKYGNPPIVEVVAEFRFVPTGPWALTVPGLVSDRLRGQFPRKRLLKVLEGEAAAEATGIRQELTGRPGCSSCTRARRLMSRWGLIFWP